MVFIAIVLVTVSTLAVHGDEVSTGRPIIPRGCEGNSSCAERPADYPQEEIDYFLQNNPAFVRRMKREAGLAGWESCEDSQKLELEEEGKEGNCKRNVKCDEPLFPNYDEKHLPQVIVNSQFFSQKIRQVTCRAPGEQCFGDLTQDAKCKQIQIPTTLYVYDKSSNKIKPVQGIINVDCACQKDSERKT